MISNHARVGRALYLLKIDLDSFIPRVFLAYHQDEASNVLHQLLGQYRDPQKPFLNMKTQDLLSVMQSSWWDVFDRSLAGIEPSLVREVALAHEVWANRQAFTSEAAYQVLNSIQRLLAAMSSPSTLELEMLKVESLEAEPEPATVEVTGVPQQQTGAVPADAGPEASVDPDADAGADGDVSTAPPEAGNPGSTQTVQESLFQDDGVWSEAAQVETAKVEVTQEKAAQEKAAQEADLQAGESADIAVDETEPFLAELVRSLRAAGALQEGDRIVQTTREGFPADLADPESWQELTPSLAQVLADSSDNRLLRHQSELIEAVINGADVVLETALSDDSHPTLGLAVAEFLLRNPGGNALVICPSAAGVSNLAARLEGSLSALGIALLHAEGAERPGGLSTAGEGPQGVLLASVETLNRSLLADRESWEDFLAKVSLVALDGADEYRGVFGAHVAVLLRRLAHYLAILGTEPGYIVCASGCANGKELAENLVAKRFQRVSGPAWPEGKRHFIAVEPDAAGASFQVEFLNRIARAVQVCLEADRVVLVYAAKEDLARKCYAAAVEHLAAQGLDTSRLRLVADAFAESGDEETQPDNPPTGAGVVFAGAGPREIMGLAESDGVLLAGFPAAFRETLQRAFSGSNIGDKETFALCFALNDQENGLMARNLSTILDKQPDHLVADPGNQEVIDCHLPSLVQESGERIYSFTSEILGSAIFQELRRESANLRSRADTPQHAIDLNGNGEAGWSLVSDGVRLGSISGYRKFREAYSGAILQIFGVPYRVTGGETPAGETTGEDSSAPSVMLEPLAEGDALFTVPSFVRTAAIQDESLCLSLASGISLHLGAVRLEEQLVRVDVVEGRSGFDSNAEGPARDATEAAAGVHTISRTYTPDEDTEWSAVAPAFWIDVEGKETGADDPPMTAGGPVAGESLEALEQLFRLGLLLNFPVDNYAVITASEAGKVFVLEHSPDSLGLTKKVFDRWRDILESGTALARQCPCETGCANCLAPSFPPNRNLDKAGGLRLADRLLEATR